MIYQVGMNFIDQKTLEIYGWCLCTLEVKISTQATTSQILIFPFFKTSNNLGVTNPMIRK